MEFLTLTDIKTGLSISIPINNIQAVSENSDATTSVFIHLSETYPLWKIDVKESFKDVTDRLNYFLNEDAI